MTSVAAMIDAAGDSAVADPVDDLVVVPVDAQTGEQAGDRVGDPVGQQVDAVASVDEDVTASVTRAVRVVMIAVVRVGTLATSGVHVVSGSRVVRVVTIVVVNVVLRVVSGSRVVRVVTIVVVHAVSGSRVVRVVTIVVVRVVMIVVARAVSSVVSAVRVAMTVASLTTPRRLRRSSVARKCLPAKVLESTAKTSRLPIVRIAPNTSWTRVRCVASDFEVTNPSAQSAAQAEIVAAHHSRLLPRLMSHWHAKCERQSAIAVLSM